VFGEVVDVALHGAAVVVVRLKQLTLPLPGTAIDRTAHLEFINDLFGNQVAADVVDIDGVSADGTSVDMLRVLVGLQKLPDAFLAKGVSNYNGKYPQKSLLGLSKMSKQMGHLRREEIVCFTKTRLGPKDCIDLWVGGVDDG